MKTEVILINIQQLKHGLFNRIKGSKFIPINKFKANLQTTLKFLII